ncbi:apolipoprotein L domain-containing protein 1 isoform X2 [Amia ocellicauda]|uniref:apolipoprotein L domain-containing protein 1 isoform X2 n=1 Tax=Amia ocellicauda TaxID=2972642 RepID=UPI003463F5BF
MCDTVSLTGLDGRSHTHSQPHSSLLSTPPAPFPLQDTYEYMDGCWQVQPSVLSTPPPLPPPKPHFSGTDMQPPARVPGVLTHSQSMPENNGRLTDCWWKNQVYAELPGDFDSKETHPEGQQDGEPLSSVINAHDCLDKFWLLLQQQRGPLHERCLGLLAAADEVEQVQKNTRIARITGGTAGALGGTAAVAGVILAPFTGGISLLATAAGVGVAVAGGATRAGAAITNKVKTSSDRKKVEQLVMEYQEQMGSLCNCLKTLNTYMEELNKLFLSRTGDQQTLEAASRLLQLSKQATRAEQIASVAEGSLVGFSQGLGSFFSKKNTQKIKKGSQDELAAKIRALAQELEDWVKELEDFSQEIEKM